MVDGDIEQGKPSSEGGGQPLWPQVRTQPVEDLVATQRRKFVDAGLVDVHDPSADGTAKHPKWTDAVEAHHVSDHVTDTPALAQRWAFPLLGHQRRQKIGQVGSLGRRHLESVHGIPSQFVGHFGVVLFYRGVLVPLLQRAAGGRVIVSVYSSGAIGRLVPDDVTGLIRYVREHAG